MIHSQRTKRLLSTVVVLTGRSSRTNKTSWDKTGGKQKIAVPISPIFTIRHLSPGHHVTFATSTRSIRLPANSPPCHTDPLHRYASRSFIPLNSTATSLTDVLERIAPNKTLHRVPSRLCRPRHRPSPHPRCKHAEIPVAVMPSFATPSTRGATNAVSIRCFETTVTAAAMAAMIVRTVSRPLGRRRWVLRR